MRSHFANPQAAGAYFARRRNRAAQAATLVDDNASPAWGTIAFPANPSNGHTVTINGTILTFGTTFATGASVAATLTAALNYLDAHPISGVFVSISGDGLLVQSSTPGDDSIAIAASNATVSGATLKKQQINARVPL